MCEDGSPRPWELHVDSRAKRTASLDLPSSRNAEAGSWAAKRGPYISDLMIERRQRMIDAALDLLLQGRADGFTIREVTQRAKVSATVLYSVYGAKEGLIAAAIKHFYLQQPASQRRAARDLPGVLVEVEEAAAVTLAHPAYVRSLCDLYFSHAPSNEIYQVVRDVAIDTFLPWLEDAMAKGETVPGLSQPVICSILAGNRWHAISDWVRGHTHDEDFPDSVKMTFLIAAAGLTTGETRAGLDAALRALMNRS
jgi:AcrR family transcriptional regulator